MRTLKSLQGLNRGSHLAGILRSVWNQLGHGPTMPGDDKALACFHALKKLREMCFCLECTDFGHGAHPFDNLFKPDTV